ncbi:MAG TPA: membrane protein insertion efficiency factor YidD [Bacilli bacterium]|nr:membrane protein insertion efficiency factor YidD [Bacilli bacterium]
MKWLLLKIIGFYRKYISPMTPPSCRFHPTCSEYGMTAISRFGAFKGSFLTIVRMLKCNPFHSGGFDPVPEKKK